MKYEHKVLAADSQRLQKNAKKGIDAWEFRGVEECLDTMSKEGWEHYQSMPSRQTRAPGDYPLPEQRRSGI